MEDLLYTNYNSGRPCWLPAFADEPDDYFKCVSILKTYIHKYKMAKFDSKHRRFIKQRCLWYSNSAQRKQPVASILDTLPGTLSARVYFGEDQMKMSSPHHSTTAKNLAVWSSISSNNSRCSAVFPDNGYMSRNYYFVQTFAVR